MSRDDGSKRYMHGTHRSSTPPETLARVAPHLQAMGITRVADITGLDRLGLPVAVAVRPNARSLAVSQGKGLDLAAAKVSAIMEAAELFHAETVQGPLLWARAGEMAGHDALDPNRLPRSAENRAYDGPLAWIMGEDLERSTACWVPFGVVTADYTGPTGALGQGLLATTGGLAAGNSRDEAVCQALCELIERDAVTLWRRGEAPARQRTAIDLATIDDPAALEVLDRFAAADLKVRVWDVTSDVAVPAFFCLLAGADREDADPELGAGCHPSRRIALMRALLEAAQARLTLIAGARDDLGGELYGNARRRRRRAAATRWLHEPAAQQPFQAAPDCATASLPGDRKVVQRALGDAGFTDLIVVDLTRADIGIPVVRVLVPGLEGPDDVPDYVPGARALARAWGP